jgi:hypothetical protein
MYYGVGPAPLTANVRPLDLMGRFLPHLSCAVGLLLVVIGFVVGPGVPYQDPTPEMNFLAERQSERLAMLAVAGVLLFLIGVIWMITRWFTRHFWRKTIT